MCLDTDNSGLLPSSNVLMVVESCNITAAQIGVALLTMKIVGYDSHHFQTNQAIHRPIRIEIFHRTMKVCP